MLRTISIIFVSILILYGACQFSYNLGHQDGFEFGYPHAYTKGQVDLMLDLQKEIGMTVNKFSDKKDFNYFGSISDISVYIYEQENCKTVAIWE